MLSKKVLQFILLTFLISWSVALAAYLLEVKYGSILSMVILAVGYMPAPALATLLLQKVVHRGTLAPYGFSFKNVSWKWLLITTVGFVWFIVLGTLGLIGLLGNVLGIALFGKIDFSEATFLQQLTIFARGAFGDPPSHLPIPPVAIFLLSMVQSVIAGFTVNLPFTFGEELGWRGLLLSETQKSGFLKSNLFIGVVWGLWHAPVIAQGHNYPRPSGRGNIYDDVVHCGAVVSNGLLPAEVEDDFWAECPSWNVQPAGSADSALCRRRESVVWLRRRRRWNRGHLVVNPEYLCLR